MGYPRFKTIEVAQLYDELQSWSHIEYPFLDPNYSPALTAPIIDLTSHIATWLSEGREDVIEELWDLLTYQNTVSTYAFKKALTAQLPPWIQLSEAARNELHAIYLLTTRAALNGNQHISNVGVSLAATTLACREIVFEFGFEEEILKSIRSQINKESFLGSTYGKDKGAKLAFEKATNPLGVAEVAAERLKAIPPMSRYVVYDYIYRGWNNGFLRFDLYYDERMYGCGKEANQQYIEWLGFFSPPSDNARVPTGITKEILGSALLKHGIEYKKSASRNALIEEARKIPGLLPSLILEFRPEYQEIRLEWKEAVEDWALRVRYLEPIGAALIKFLTFSVIK